MQSGDSLALLLVYDVTSWPSLWRLKLSHDPGGDYDVMSRQRVAGTFPRSRYKTDVTDIMLGTLHTFSEKTVTLLQLSSKGPQVATLQCVQSSWVAQHFSILVLTDCNIVTTSKGPHLHSVNTSRHTVPRPRTDPWELDVTLKLSHDQWCRTSCMYRRSQSCANSAVLPVARQFLVTPEAEVLPKRVHKVAENFTSWKLCRLS